MAQAGAENATLTAEELAACQPIGDGPKLRAFCPFHGSDHRRSLSVNVDTGRFHCFQCGAWGYTEEARRCWREEHIPRREAHCWECGSEIDSESNHVCPVCLWIKCACGACADPRKVPGGCRRPEPGELKAGIRIGDQQVRPIASSGAAPRRVQPTPVRADLLDVLTDYFGAWDSRHGKTLARGYLQKGRGVPLGVALAHRLGYAASSKWAHVTNGKRIADWKWGRIVVPHETPDGTLVNLYGRAVDNAKVQAPQQHDHLPGNKGYFNASAIRDGTGPLAVCEGPFDALTLITAGHERTVAIFGVNGWRWDWARDVREIVLALDADKAGQNGWRNLAREARLRGKAVAVVPPEAYGGCNDANEAWVKGVLDLVVLADLGLNVTPQPVVEDGLTERAPSPDQPTEPCWACGGRRFWSRRSGVWVCLTCHPAPDPRLIAATCEVATA